MKNSEKACGFLHGIGMKPRHGLPPLIAEAVQCTLLAVPRSEKYLLQNAGFVVTTDCGKIGEPKAFRRDDRQGAGTATDSTALALRRENLGFIGESDHRANPTSLSASGG